MNHEHDDHPDRVIDTGNWRAHIKYEGRAHLYATNIDVRDALGKWSAGIEADQDYEITVYDLERVDGPQDIYYVKSWEFKRVQQFAEKVAAGRSYLIQTVSRALTGDP